MGSTTSGEEYEVIGQPEIKIVLPSRSACPRGAPLSQEQWDSSKDTNGKIINSNAIREIVFRGGIIPSLRYEVWKFLLNYYPWNSTFAERIELKKYKTDEYYRMKLQWKSITADQENRFSDFRDRKSLIGKKKLPTFIFIYLFFFFIVYICLFFFFYRKGC